MDHIASFTGAQKLGGNAWYALLVYVHLPMFLRGAWNVHKIYSVTLNYVSQFLWSERCLNDCSLW